MIQLNNKKYIPQLGLGTYELIDYQQILNTLSIAYKAGYRLIDTASLYENEQQIGKAIKELQINVKELFITTKINVDKISYEGAKESVQNSLKNLQVNSLDLVLIHWPGCKQDRIECWKSLEEMVDQGLIKSIGVSNFLPRHLETILKVCKIFPVINQIEIHPYYIDFETINYCKSKNITIESYCPLAKGNKELFNEQVIKNLSEKYQKTPAQIILKWHLQNELIVIPKSSSKERIIQNIQLFDFQMADKEIELINKMNKKQKIDWDPEVVDE